ncbi:ABC transporter ATP-binding protein [Methylopila musalis]|uniref:ABC transporter ATP-binding protein n=1 Tax=Methylopila musalis TaxID=1134781 RepID=A0ABW3ZAV4_9HYPH
MSAGALRVTGLTVGYGRRAVASDLTLPPLEPGEVVALVGPNAAGKSTILKALAGLTPARGDIRLGAADLQALSRGKRAELVGFMPQTLPSSSDLTVLEGMMAALRAVPGEGGALEERALAALESLDAGPLALKTFAELSGGERQLASVAQSVARQPRLLLLDEPTSALDLARQHQVMALARSYAREGRVVVAVLHDLALAALWADRMVVLSAGRAHAVGQPDEALTPDILAEVYGVVARVERCSRGRLQVIVDGLAGPRGVTG